MLKSEKYFDETLSIINFNSWSLKYNSVKIKELLKKVKVIFKTQLHTAITELIKEMSNAVDKKHYLVDVFVDLQNVQVKVSKNNRCSVWSQRLS